MSSSEPILINRLPNVFGIPIGAGSAMAVPYADMISIRISKKYWRTSNWLDSSRGWSSSNTFESDPRTSTVLGIDCGFQPLNHPDAAPRRWLGFDSLDVAVFDQFRIRHQI